MEKKVQQYRNQIGELQHELEKRAESIDGGDVYRIKYGEALETIRLVKEDYADYAIKKTKEIEKKEKEVSQAKIEIELVSKEFQTYRNTVASDYCRKSEVKDLTSKLDEKKAMLKEAKQRLDFLEDKVAELTSDLRVTQNSLDKAKEELSIPNWTYIHLKLQRDVTEFKKRCDKMSCNDTISFMLKEMISVSVKRFYYFEPLLRDINFLSIQ